MGARLYLEVKTKSPFGYRADRSWDEQLRFCEKHADVVSIHTDKRWGGSFERLRRAVGLIDKPVLAKGIHETDDELRRAFEAGADEALVVGRRTDVDGAVLHEPYDLEQFERWARAGVEGLVFNHRDLRTGDESDATFDEARSMTDAFLMEASRLQTPADVHPGANACLVGRHKRRFVSCRT